MVAEGGIAVRQLAGWGNFPRQACRISRPERYSELAAAGPQAIARGQGRSYGDAALNDIGLVILTERINRLLHLDQEAGVLHAEAGVTLEEILAAIVPHGWFLPVTPGTKHASLGGCVAADVHGKNHHRDGTICDHVHELEMILADGSRIRCSPDTNGELFRATAGGMGLTGIIGEVALKLRPIETAQMVVEHRPAKDLENALQMLTEPAFDDQYTVAWIDCLARGTSLGRSVVMRGHHAMLADLPEALRPIARSSARRKVRTLPFNFPQWTLNSLTVGAFNALYFHSQGRKTQPFLTDYDRYFYPLDSMDMWNRMYGNSGFVQYQCVLPAAGAHAGLGELLQLLAASRRSSFLAVLKRFGKQGRGLLSFPMPGYTLALDLPVRDAGLFTLLAELDNVVMRYGGRVYLAKDARLSPETFRAMYPGYAEWLTVKAAVDKDNRFSSSLSRRLRIGFDG